MPYKHRFGPFAPEVYRVPLAYPFRWPSGPENCAEEAAEQAIDMITKQIGAENVAAVVIEPIAGEGGFIEPAKGFLPRVAEFCKANGIVFVADEVQTGFARTGTLFACEDEGVVPDIITTAKGIAGGLPLAAVTGRADIMDSVHVGGLGGTYGGNPLACEAALGVLETIEEEDLVAKARRIGEIMLPRLRSLQERFDVIGDVRGRGAMIAIELVEPGTKEPNPTAVQAIVKRCHAEGLLVLTAGTYGNVLRFLPPLVIPEHLLEEGLGILEKAIAEL
jgi:4-aminobutyrate aminotransferase/(S)-3-amino-2-methylpropionate transaminase